MKHLFYIFIKLTYLYIILLPLIMFFYPCSWQYSSIGEIVGEDIIRTQYQVGNRKYFAYEFKYMDSNGITWSMNQPKNEYSIYTFTYPFTPIEKYQIDSLCNHAKPVEYRTWMHILVLFASVIMLITLIVAFEDLKFGYCEKWHPCTIHKDVLALYNNISKTFKIFFGYGR